MVFVKKAPSSYVGDNLDAEVFIPVCSNNIPAAARISTLARLSSGERRVSLYQMISPSVHRRKTIHDEGFGSLPEIVIGTITSAEAYEI